MLLPNPLRCLTQTLLNISSTSYYRAYSTLRLDYQSYLHYPNVSKPPLPYYLTSTSPTTPMDKMTVRVPSMAAQPRTFHLFNELSKEFQYKVLEEAAKPSNISETQHEQDRIWLDGSCEEWARHKDTIESFYYSKIRWLLKLLQRRQSGTRTRGRQMRMQLLRKCQLTWMR